MRKDDGMKVLTFGELLLRLSAPSGCRLFQKDVFESSFCGSEANVAVALANFGVKTGFVSKLPDSDVGRAAERSLMAFGVDTSGISYGKERMGLFYLERGASQRPSKVIYDRAGSAFACSSPKDYDWDALFSGVKWFHWSGITPALSPVLPSILSDALKAAKKKGITVSCDLNYRKKLWSSEEARSVMPELLRLTDVCIGNEEDAFLTLGIKPEGSEVGSGKLKKESYAMTADAIRREYGCSCVAFSLRESVSASVNGWSGVISVGGKLYSSGKYEINLVDRLGGGDSFAAGIIYGLINGMDPGETVGFAAAASCLKQATEGDYSRVTVEEVTALARSGGNGRVER